jgi:hypothetical protein
VQVVSISLFGKCFTTADDKTDGWPLAEPIGRLGLNIVPLGDRNATHYIAFDHSQKALKAIEDIVPANRRMLFAFEPEAVNPLQHLSKTRSEYFQTVIGSRRHRIKANDVEMKFGTLPDVPHKLDSSDGSQSRGSAAMLNENKFSFVTGNLYKKRTDILLEISRAGIPTHVGGKNWDKSSLWQAWRQLLYLYAVLFTGVSVDLSQYHGPLTKERSLTLHGRVPSEVGFLSQFEFALVVENDPNYLSEKLFNAISAGCVPLYLGPPLHEFGLPSDLAVQMNALPGSFARTVEQMTEAEKRSTVEAGRLWLGNEENFRAWTHTTALNQMANLVDSFLKTAI